MASIQGGLSVGLRSHIVLAQELLSTVTRQSDDLENAALDEVGIAPGVLIKVVTDSEAGTPTFTPKMQWKTIDGVYVDVWTAAAAISADGTYLYYLSSQAVATIIGSLTEVVAIPVPPTWRFELTYAGTPANDKADTYAEIAYVN